ncbi:MAG: PAS domain-containing protein [Aquabacterium sp.]|nr:PAS domain-containing protein [Aquabacterium sp.]
MRSNLPILDEAFPFPAGASLVSTTDLKGRITYCNPAFIQVSGYAREELLGQPHNLIRHPDMPAEAFRDMWATIASGQPWTALVKNRRKDGRYYWVRANVTPLVVDGKPVGYMSVRTAPSAEEVAQAGQLYACLNADAHSASQRLGLRSGQVVRFNWMGRLRSAVNLDLAGQLTLAAVILASLSFLMGAVAAGGVSLLQGWATLLASVMLIGLVSLGRGVFVHLAVRPIKELLNYANVLAAGDLSVACHSDRTDVIGQFTRSLNQLQVNLRAIVRDARTEVDHMLVSTQEIAQGNQDLSARTESQASSLEQTTASMAQITGTVRLSADTAEQAASLAVQTTSMTQQCDEAVGDLTQTVVDMEASSRRINDIIQVIDSIAFQTNILALNAAVEAARAGEQGRGFAVVAAEVRALSQRTGSAAKEVRQLITASGEKVLACSELSGSARGAMQHALQSVDSVGTLVAEISHGAREQLTAISQVNTAVTQLEGITQQNAAAVNQIASSSSTLAERARVLADAVKVFRLDAQGSAH